MCKNFKFIMNIYKSSSTNARKQREKSLGNNMIKETKYSYTLEKIYIFYVSLNTYKNEFL